MAADTLQHGLLHFVLQMGIILCIKVVVLYSTALGSAWWYTFLLILYSMNTVYTSINEFNSVQVLAQLLEGTIYG